MISIAYLSFLTCSDIVMRRSFRPFDRLVRLCASFVLIAIQHLLLVSHWHCVLFKRRYSHLHPVSWPSPASIFPTRLLCPHCDDSTSLRLVLFVWMTNLHWEDLHVPHSEDEWGHLCSFFCCFDCWIPASRGKLARVL